VPVEPVKWMPPSSGLDSRTSLISEATPGMKLITPGGSPAASRSFITYQDPSTPVVEGFQTATFPMSAGDVVRLAPMAVKLNGLMA